MLTEQDGDRYRTMVALLTSGAVPFGALRDGPGHRSDDDRHSQSRGCKSLEKTKRTILALRALVVGRTALPAPLQLFLRLCD